LRYVKDGRLASHVPDLFAWRQGVPELCDVKSEERVDDPTFRVRVVAGGGMTGSRWPLSVGGRLMVDGEAITVTTVDGREVKGVTGRGEPVQFVLTRVEDSPSAVVDKGEWRFGQVLLDAGALCDGQLREAAELLAHLNEASFGYRSGDPGRPAPGEPRERFDPDRTTLGDRLAAKAAELGCSVETLRRRRRLLQRRGLAGLVDGRHARSVTGSGVDETLRDAIIAEARELESASDGFDRRYQQLLRHAEQARTAAGFATANLTRALARPPGTMTIYGMRMNELDDLLAEQVAYYRAFAPEYLEDAGVEGVTEETQDATARAIHAALDDAAPLGDVLELACGPGSFTSELASRATSVTGLDASPEMLEIAAARTAGATNVHFTQADLFTWTPDRRYPFAFFGFWLSHVPPERFAEFWSTIASTLTPDGRVMFIDDGHRTTDELINGPESSTIERQLRDGRRFRAVKVPLEPASLERSLQELGWNIDVRPLAGPFFLGLGRRAS
jgi:SAM-dependent methyltransferase